MSGSRARLRAYAAVKVVADAHLAEIENWFSGFGSLVLLPSEEINSDSVRDADALLVRSVTVVDADLLAESRVRFVGSATSGLDHIDTAALRQRGIRLAHAGGSNADAVVDYCLAALGHARNEGLIAKSVRRIGLVGHGHTGSRLAARLLSLGFEPVVNDPPLAAVGQLTVANHSLAEIADCPVVSLHVPLSVDGPSPTLGLIGEPFLHEMTSGARQCLLINSCRGGVVDEDALLARLRQGSGLSYVADVWRNEPLPEPALVDAASLATPHIAGYSARAKRRATELLCASFCEHFGLALPPAQSKIEPCRPLKSSAEVDPWSLPGVALPLWELSEEFKAAVRKGHAAEAFRVMRQRLRERLEFSELAPVGPDLSPAWRTQATALGFAATISGDIGLALD